MKPFEDRPTKMHKIPMQFRHSLRIFVVFVVVVFGGLSLGQGCMRVCVCTYIYIYIDILFDMQWRGPAVDLTAVARDAALDLTEASGF